MRKTFARVLLTAAYVALLPLLGCVLGGIVGAVPAHVGAMVMTHYVVSGGGLLVLLPFVAGVLLQG